MNAYEIIVSGFSFSYEKLYATRFSSSVFVSWQSSLFGKNFYNLFVKPYFLASVGLNTCSVITVGKSTNIAWQKCRVKKEEKQKLLGQKGCVIWITGLSGSGLPPLTFMKSHVFFTIMTF